MLGAWDLLAGPLRTGSASQLPLRELQQERGIACSAHPQLRRAAETPACRAGRPRPRGVWLKESKEDGLGPNTGLSSAVNTLLGQESSRYSM